MIVPARVSDRKDVAHIWENCFGDPNDYIGFCLDRLFSPETCIVDKISGKIVSMLFLLPAVWHTDTSDNPVQYIYAAATLPEYRRQGIMAAMLEEAHTRGIQSGCLFSCLLPESEKLYSYYAQRGFSASFAKREIQISRGELERLAQTPYEEISADTAAIAAMRRERFVPAVLWPEKMLSYALDEWRLTGGDIFAFRDGYCLAICEGNTLSVKETCIPSGNFGRLAGTLLLRYGCKKFRFCLPAYSDVSQNSRVRKSGMARICGGSLRLNHVYFNLMLD